MPELTANQTEEIQGLMQRIAPALGAALTEQLHGEASVDLLDVRPVSLTDLLSRTDSVLQTLFTVSSPVTSEGVLVAGEEAARVPVDLMQGMSGGDPTIPISEPELDTLSTGMSGLVRGLAVGLSEATGDHYEIDASSTHVGALTVPPVFALEGSAIEAQLVVMLAQAEPIVLTLLFTLALMTEAQSGAKGGGAEFNAGSPMSEDDVAALFSQTAADGFGGMAPTLPLPGGGAAPFGEPPGHGSGVSAPRGLDMILDIPLDVTVELGRVRMLIRDVLELSTGSVIELDRIAGEPVDLLVNGRLVAKGEVVVIEDNFGLRISEIVSPAERVAGIGRGDRR